MHEYSKVMPKEEFEAFKNKIEGFANNLISDVVKQFETHFKKEPGDRVRFVLEVIALEIAKLSAVVDNNTSRTVMKIHELEREISILKGEVH